MIQPSLLFWGGDRRRLFFGVAVVSSGFSNDKIGSCKAAWGQRAGVPIKVPNRKPVQVESTTRSQIRGQCLSRNPSGRGRKLGPSCLCWWCWWWSKTVGIVLRGQHRIFRFDRPRVRPKNCQVSCRISADGWGEG